MSATSYLLTCILERVDAHLTALVKLLTAACLCSRDTKAEEHFREALAALEDVADRVRKAAEAFEEAVSEVV